MENFSRKKKRVSTQIVKFKTSFRFLIETTLIPKLAYQSIRYQIFPRNLLNIQYFKFPNLLDIQNLDINTILKPYLIFVLQNVNSFLSYRLLLAEKRELYLAKREMYVSYFLLCWCVRITLNFLNPCLNSFSFLSFYLDCLDNITNGLRNSLNCDVIKLYNFFVDGWKDRNRIWNFIWIIWVWPI